MSSAEAYGGARCCLDCARGAADAVEFLDWMNKAAGWRELARALRRAGR